MLYLTHIPFQDIPLDRLCPPLPNRAFYIYWIHDLLQLQSRSSLLNPQPPTVNSTDVGVERDVVGIDIGTGASCIFPLIGTSVFPSWRFVATEIDLISQQCAEKNIQTNTLVKRIDLRRAPLPPPYKSSSSQQPLAPFSDIRETSSPSIMNWLTELSHDNQKDVEAVPRTARGMERAVAAAAAAVDGNSEIAFDFSMCNPPFFSSLSEAEPGRREACVGSTGEMVAEGGEMGFTCRMIEESKSCSHKVRSVKSFRHFD